MRLEDAFFANSAEITPDGRLFVMGGGIDTVNVPRFGVCLPALSFVARVHFDPQECDRDYLALLKIRLPDESDPGFTPEIRLRPSLPIQSPERGSTTQIAVSIYGLPLPCEGDYAFELSIDGKTLGERHLIIALDPSSVAKDQS